MHARELTSSCCPSAGCARTTLTRISALRPERRSDVESARTVLSAGLRERCRDAFCRNELRSSFLQKQVGQVLRELSARSGGELGLPQEEVRVQAGYVLDLVVSFNGEKARRPCFLAPRVALVPSASRRAIQ